MHGLMMDTPLLISSLIEYANTFHGDTEIVSRTHDHPLHRYTYRDAHARSKQLAKALVRLGVEHGDRIATLGWNDFRHFEIYYAVSGMGAICHTLNPRLFPEQLVYIINHAEDAYIFVDPMFLPLVEKLAPQFKGVKGYVVMSDEAHMPTLASESNLGKVMCYETLVGSESAGYAWPSFDENTASSLCYTSGTTGHPKGALFSHRSTVLHSFGVCLPDALNFSSRDAILPVVPMFHANAWGVPYAAAMCGAKLVFPGPRLDGASVHQLLVEEGVTVTAGVPTVWLMLLNYLREKDERIDNVERLIIGGSAAPRSMIEAFQREFGVRVIHAWGMTETSPLGCVSNLKHKHESLPEEEQVDIQLKQGRGIYGVEMRIVDDSGSELPRDGKAFGELQVRGPWVVSSYYQQEGEQQEGEQQEGEQQEGEQGASVVDNEGWFSTGDVSTLDADGYMQITDRSKDVIKSGGEWISSIDLENEVISHPAVAEAAVIGIAHPKWDERPLLIAVLAEGATATREELLAHLEGRVAKWWMPDDVIFVDELPHTATGKISKKTLRERFKDHVLPTV